MNRYDENSVENLLGLLKNKPAIKPSANFTFSVMERIRAEQSKNVKALDKLYFRFSAAAFAAAAACAMLAFNFFTIYTPQAAELAAVDYFNIIF